MLTRRTKIGVAVASVALMAALPTATTQASADETRLTVTPAVYQASDSTQSGQIQLVRHGWGGHCGGYGYGSHGGYRGYGYRGGYYRPYSRPFIGIGVSPGYGFSAGYGYGGYPAHGYRGCW
jgi:hypothetical protein